MIISSRILNSTNNWGGQERIEMLQRMRKEADLIIKEPDKFLSHTFSKDSVLGHAVKMGIISKRIKEELEAELEAIFKTK